MLTPFIKTHTLWLLPLATMTLTTACSSQPEKPPEPEFTAYFSSHIKPDGEKTFQIAFHPDKQFSERPNKGGKGGKGGGPNGQGGGRDGGKGKGGRGGHDIEAMRERREKMQEIMLAHTEDILRNNGYCRSGYVLAKKEREERRSFPTVKGHCQDKATPEDLENFPNAAATYEIKEESLDF